LRLVSALEDVICVFETRFKIAEYKRGIYGDVVFGCFMEARRAVTHRGLRIEDGFKFLIIHIDQLQCLLGNLRTGRRYGGDGLARITNRIAHDQHVLNHAWRQGRHEVHGAVFSLRHVLWQQDGLDAWHFLGPGCINFQDTGMRVRAAQELGVQHPRQRNVDRKALATLDLFIRIGPKNTFANDSRLCHSVTPTSNVSGLQPPP